MGLIRMLFANGRKYANKPESFIKDEAWFIANIRNLDGLIVHDSGVGFGVDRRHAIPRIDTAELKSLFEQVWADVKSKRPRKYWLYETNVAMAKIHGSRPRSEKF